MAKSLVETFSFFPRFKWMDYVLLDSAPGIHLLRHLSFKIQNFIVSVNDKISSDRINATDWNLELLPCKANCYKLFVTRNVHQMDLGMAFWGWNWGWRWGWGWYTCCGHALGDLCGTPWPAQWNVTSGRNSAEKAFYYIRTTVCWWKDTQQVFALARAKLSKYKRHTKQGSNSLLLAELFKKLVNSSGFR